MNQCITIESVSDGKPWNNHLDYIRLAMPSPVNPADGLEAFGFTLAAALRNLAHKLDGER